MAQLVKNPPATWETWVDSWVGEIAWRSHWLPTPVFWLGEFHGSYSPWGCKELDMTEQLSLHFTSGAIDNVLSHVLWAVLQQLKLPPGEDVNCMLPISTQIPDHLEPEGWWYWLLITSPPNNQKNVQELAGHTTYNPFPSHTCLKTFSWKSSRLLNTSYPGRLDWLLQQTLHFPPPQPSISGLALLSPRRGPKRGLVTSSYSKRSAWISIIKGGTQLIELTGNPGPPAYSIYLWTSMQ